MGVNVQTNEVVALYEREGLTIDEIVEETGLADATVKMILDTKSESFKKKRDGIDAAIQEVYGEQDFRLVLGALRDIALYGENENARVRACQYIIEEVTNRNNERVERIKDNRVAALTGLGISAAIINARMIKAQQAINRAPAPQNNKQVTVDVT